MRRDSLIIGVFALSGAAGLIYEVVWARQLVLVFGNTTQAVAAILTGFFGGMALGSYFGGRLADRFRRGLLLYGILEILVAVVAISTPAIFGLIGSAYQSFFVSLENNLLALSLVRFGLALGALGPVTVLMGATLPTLTRYLSRNGDHLSAAFGSLYTANTIGAVFGCMIAGLVLIELLGLEGALRAGAACSATAGVIAILLQSRWDSGDGGPAPARKSDALARSAPGLAIGVAFLSGATSLAYQTLWTRLLAAGSGNLTYVFTAILTIFLIGLAGGADAFTHVRGRIRNPVRTLALLQAGTAVLVIAGLVLVLSHPAPVVGRYSLAILSWATLFVVLPTTFLMGFSLPLAGSLVSRSGDLVGEDTGNLLAANTLGAIVGTLGVPLVLIPIFGSPTSLALVATISAAAAIALGWASREPRAVRRAWPVAPGVAACVLAAVAMLSGWIVDPTVSRINAQGGSLFATQEDEIASVQAAAVSGEKFLWVAGTSMTYLTIDTRLMPVLPLILRPASQNALVVAFGMGSAYREALIEGLRTDAVELVPSVPSMFPWYFADAAQALSNPLGHVIIADGRNYVELTTNTYDIIVVDPPPPIQSSGASVISSLEFYEAASHRLTPGGVMTQWVPVGQTVDEFRAAVRTFQTVFSDVIVAVGPGGNGYYLLGSSAPISIDPLNVRSVLARPGVVADLSAVGDAPASTLDEWSQVIPGLLRLSGDEVASFAGSGPLVTDDHPLPEYFLLRQAFGGPSTDLTPQTLGGKLPVAATGLP